MDLSKYNGLKETGLRVRTGGASMTAEQWNRRYPVGTKVRYYHIKNVNKGVETETLSEAWTLGHGAAVVKVKGRAGGVSLDHLDVPVGSSEVQG